MIKELGVYRGAANPQGVQEFERWLGAPVQHVLDFTDGSTWTSISNPSWYAGRWKDYPYKVTYSIPLIPSTGGTLAEGAKGSYNKYFDQLGRSLVNNFQSSAVLRLGWEFNGRWYKWYPGQHGEQSANFISYWRQIVDTLRKIPGQGFKYDWCPTLGRANMDAPDSAYPGDDYVDYIGTDVYDQSWISNYKDVRARWTDYREQPYGLLWHRDFAKAHNKPMTHPEWGLCIRSDGHGGGDAPYFISKMWTWISTHRVASHCYFEFDAPDGRHRLMNGQFPNGAAKYKELFSSV